MAEFTFTCPKCSHDGSSTELSCYNCGGKIERIETANNYEEMQCITCGITQTPSCPTDCGAVITFKTTSTSSSADFWTVLIIGLAAAWWFFR